MYLIQNIKYLRRIYKLSQTELGDQVGKSKEVISTYERGKIQPSLEVVYEMSKIFSVSMEDMLSKDLDEEGFSPAPAPEFVEFKEQSLSRLNELLESRVKVLEREIKRIAPDLAAELGVR